MMRVSAGLLLAALGSVAVFGQAPAPAPAFELADVRVRARSSSPSPFMSGGVLRGGRYDLRNATLLDMIQLAYNVSAPPRFWVGRTGSNAIASTSSRRRRRQPRQTRCG
jgi:hypothetical protein